MYKPTALIWISSFVVAAGDINLIIAVMIEIETVRDI